jgi:hypothetical protein
MRMFSWSNRLAPAGLFLSAIVGLGSACGAALAGDYAPVRWNTGGAVWTTSAEAMRTFLTSGDITDRGLEGGLHRSGWTSEEVRQGMNKTYAVDFLNLARYLYSDTGVTFLTEQTRSYVPYATLRAQAVQALRSAIIADAADGQISSAGIMTNLPVDFRLADISGNPPFDGSQNVWPRSGCEGPQQCTSLFSWAVFLPANLQAISQGSR